MFYCYACAKKRGWPHGGYMFMSQGRCEICGSQELCADVPSKNLPMPQEPAPELRSVSEFLITCTPENAERFATWLGERGGITLWKSQNLSNPGASWCTPALTDGVETPRPTWESDNSPALVVTDSDFVGVETLKEFKRLPVSLLRKGMKVVLTDGSKNKLLKALAQAGEGACYTFEDGEAVIWQEEGTVSLTKWLEANRTEEML